jgi:hypothetical protein
MIRAVRTAVMSGLGVIDSRAASRLEARRPRGLVVLLVQLWDAARGHAVLT